MLWEWIKMQEIEIFCDGSSLGNPGPGGYAAILRYKDKEKPSVGANISPRITAWN